MPRPRTGLPTRAELSQKYTFLKGSSVVSNPTNSDGDDTDDESTSRGPDRRYYVEEQNDEVSKVRRSNWGKENPDRN